MDFKSINVRHIYGAQRYCEKIRICCQYKITQDTTVSREYICDNDVAILQSKQQKSIQARPIFHPDSNIYTEDAPPYNQRGLGGSDTVTTGGNVISCPSIKCWELVSENIGESITYYEDCTDISISECPDSTVTLTGSIPNISNQEGWLEISYNRQESADQFGKVISISRQCTKFYYAKTKAKIYIAGPIETINKTRQYNETILTTYIFEECDNQQGDV